jgi:hypothetical protein
MRPLVVLATLSAALSMALALTFVLTIDWDAPADASGNPVGQSLVEQLPLATYIAALLFVAIVGAGVIALVFLRRRAGFACLRPARQGALAWLAGLAGLAVLTPLIGVALSMLG